MGTFRLPDLGEGLAEAEILRWHVAVGDHVRADQPMVSVETAKAVVEVPAPFSGVVTALRGAPGDIVPTGAPLIEFDSGTVVGSMPETRDEELTGFPPATEPNRGWGTRAVPAARALARRLNIDIASLAGSGRGGLITVEDVLRNVDGSSAGPDALENPGAAAPRLLADGSAQPLRGMRRAMAHSMSQSRDQVCGSTVCDDADIHGWSAGGGYLLRLMRAMIGAWRIEPALNAWYDSKALSRTLIGHIDLGVAIDTPNGLIVPVVRNIQDKTAEQLREAVAAHRQAALERRTAAEDLRDFTLMLSNFGTLAGRYGIPIVVPPAVAILGAGKVREDAVVVAGQVRAHRRMPLSLSFDHRCITGGEACRFLAAVISDLEKPE